MSGQSITDRIAAAQHSMTGSAISKAVCKATTHEVSGPKKKHLDCEYAILFERVDRQSPSELCCAYLVSVLLAGQHHRAHWMQAEISSTELFSPSKGDLLSGKGLTRFQFLPGQTMGVSRSSRVVTCVTDEPCLGLESSMKLQECSLLLFLLLV